MRLFAIIGRLVASAVLLSLCVVAQAQQTLADAQWFQRQIALGVVWKQYQFDQLFGSKQVVSVVEADLTVPGVQVEFPYLASTRGRASTFVPQQYPTAKAAVNGSYFDTSTGGGGSTTYLRLNNSVITSQTNGSWWTNGGLTIGSTGAFQVRGRPSGGWNGYTTRPDAMANGPLLVLNTTTQNFSTIGAHCSARHPRTAVGINAANTKAFLVTVDGRSDQADGMTCDELSEVMKQLGCDDALNMDGGGSTTMWISGELNNGIVNYPSDNGLFDHAGERSCSNAIAILATTAAPQPAWDAQLQSVSYAKVMVGGTEQTAVLKYKNLGSNTWLRNSTSLVVTRPRTRTSPFYTAASWIDQTTPARLKEASVAPGGTGTFEVVLTAPNVASATVLRENFGLWQNGVGHFGPPDHEPYLKIALEPASVSNPNLIIIESREGGQNYTRYSETGGWADVSTNCTAPGLTPGVGQRYGSTFRTAAGAKSAFFRPSITLAGAYKVSIAYGNGGSLARNPVTYEVFSAGAPQEVLVNQTQNANTWVELGTFTFAAGTAGYVEMSNEDIDLSGNMYAAAARFELLNSAVEDWSMY